MSCLTLPDVTGNPYKKKDKAMRVLVTGNLGYIGTVLTPMLTQRGHEVFGYDTGFFEDCLLMPAAGGSLVRQYKGDMREIDSLVLEDVDAVVHLAALSNDPMGELNPDLTHQINTEASFRFAKMARDAGVQRFIFASSCSIYGASDDMALTEESPFNPQTAYARSKVEFEAALHELAADSFSPTYLRNATAYGLSPRLRVDLVVNNLTGWGFVTGKVKLMSDGRAWRPLVHIEDISLAVCEALEAEREDVHDQPLNVGNEKENYQIRTVAETVAEIMPDTEVTFAKGAEADSRTYNVSFEKIRKVLPGFKTKWTVKKGVAQLYKAFQEHGMSDQGFNGRLYIRLKQLQHLMDEQRVDSNLRWQ
jgi:nucleoside-diphosphate-sugar epimerase